MKELKDLPETAEWIYRRLKAKTFGIKDIKIFPEGDSRALRYWIGLGMVGGGGKLSQTNPGMTSSISTSLSGFS